MMDSEERPYSMHIIEDRECQFCGDLFPAHHGLQRYCPSKFGKKDYCKYEQKKLVNEKRLSEKVSELAKTGMQVHQSSQLAKNKEALSQIMGTAWHKTVDSRLLDNLGYDIRQFDYKTIISGTPNFLLHVGDYTLEWVGLDEATITFKINSK